jgi:gas vesicle protein
LEEEEEMEKRRHNHKNLFKGFLFGGLLGATAGILLAPKAGRELRAGIKGKGEKVLKDTRQFYSDTKAKAETTYENARHRIFAVGGGGMTERSFWDIESPEEMTGEA